MSQLSSDILYEIIGYLIPKFPRSTPLVVVLETRRSILYPLLFVCRLFRATFEPLLYHSVAICYDDSFMSVGTDERRDWKSVEAWVRRIGKHADRALWKTLEGRTEVCWWVRRMELDWERTERWKDNETQTHADLASFVQRFERLSDLAIGPSHSDVGIPATPLWPVQSIPIGLQRLVLRCPVAYGQLSTLFQLPHLDELVLSRIVLPETENDAAHLEIRSRMSTVTSLNITACLSESQILHILLQPKRLQNFVFITEGDRPGNWIPPRPSVLERGLAPFQHTLVSLELDIDDARFAEWPPIDCKDMAKRPVSADLKPLESLQAFEKLSRLRIPSLCLFGMPGEGYSRNGISRFLPRSLESLDVEFGVHDPLFHCLPRRFCRGHAVNSREPSSVNQSNIVWMLSFAQTAHFWLPKLHKVAFHDRGMQIWGNSPFISKLFLPHDHSTSQEEISAVYSSLGMHLQLDSKFLFRWRCGYCQKDLRREFLDDYYYDWDDYPPSESLYGFGGGWSPLFGKEPTWYSDSPQGSEVEWLEYVKQGKEEEAETERWYRHYERRKRGEESSSSESAWSTSSCWDEY